MATRLFVGNLPDNIAEDDLRSVFSSYGEITNLDLKSKSTADNEKKFAFVTISGSNYEIETCIKHFTNEDFKGNRLYVTRARESFLERLQRERLEAQQKDAQKEEKQKVAKKTPTLKLGEKLNPRKRKIEEPTTPENSAFGNTKSLEKNIRFGDGLDMYGKITKISETINHLELEDKSLSKGRRNNNTLNTTSNTYTNINVFENGDAMGEKRSGKILEMHKKKHDSDLKRMEAMKKKSQEFKQKKMIVKSGLTDVDKLLNKKIIFSENADDNDKTAINGHEKNISKHMSHKKQSLFDNDDDEDNSDELNFEIKKQFEGKKGQQILDLQSRYKSDKRFVLNERFIENEEVQETIEGDNQVELNQMDEKAKQLNILENVLGVSIRKRVPEEDRDGKKNKSKLGMLRYDPSQPEHAKFLAPVEDTKREITKKNKKKKYNNEIQEQPKPEEPRPEVSKEQFYKVSDNLKEAIAQPNTFSLRSLFGNTEPAEEESKEEADYIPLEPPRKSKIKNPLQPVDKNPFVYDSSDSEAEEVDKEIKNDTAPVVTENKAVWKESFFFAITDHRLEEGLAFFNRSNEMEANKERRELKSLVKKRIYNKERKDQKQMFKKKIGGRKKIMKKSFRRKN